MPRKGQKREPLRLICPTCKTGFTRDPGYICKGQNKWCSNKCRYSVTPEDRFWSKVHKGDDSECWEWHAKTVQRGGYGSLFVVRDGKRCQVAAHRFSWELHRFPITPDVCVLHRCDNPPCVNPNHLFLGTRDDNNKDMANKGRCVPACKYRVLTDDQARQIIERTKAGERYSDVARDYNILPGYVGMIARGQAYRRLHDAS